MGGIGLLCLGGPSIPYGRRVDVSAPPEGAGRVEPVYGILNARSNDFGYRHLTYVSISRFLALMHCNMGHGTMEARSVHGS